MPIKIANDLPAARTLEKENIFYMSETRALTQNIRPLHIFLLNLMPTKIETETQFARVLGNTPIQIELDLIAPAAHISSHISEEHMLSFYRTFADVRQDYFDGMIITGAPVEQMAFEEVDYLDELCEIMAWSKTHVHFHPALMLGCPGRPVFPLRHCQASAGSQGVRCLFPSYRARQLHPVPRV